MSYAKIFLDKPELDQTNLLGKRLTQPGTSVQSAVLPDVSINTRGRHFVSTSA